MKDDTLQKFDLLAMEWRSLRAMRSTAAASIWAWGIINGYVPDKTTLTFPSEAEATEFFADVKRALDFVLKPKHTSMRCP